MPCVLGSQMFPFSVVGHVNLPTVWFYTVTRHPNCNPVSSFVVCKLLAKVLWS
jgi:hypothetical protein